MKILPYQILVQSFLLFSLLFNSVKAHAQKPSQEVLINNLIKQLTIEEKVALIHGIAHFSNGNVPRLGIPSLIPSDGPHGIRMDLKDDWSALDKGNDSGTYLPVLNTLAATWNKQLAYSFGKVLGSEGRYRKKHLLAGPGINIIRNPLNGRNFEYMSEDPFLISKMVVKYVNGVQSEGISACVKHFIANNQETNRGIVNVEMSDRALHEIYLPGFKAAVIDGKVNAVMGSYSKFRGQYCTHNEYLVNKLLKGDWKFDGLLISDWGSVHDTHEAIYNGTDLEMGTELEMKEVNYNNFFLGDTVVTLVKSGQVPESLIDEKVRRILRLLYRSNAFTNETKGGFATDQHISVALKVAEEGIVLLKNDQRVLPLKKTIKNVLIVGVTAKNKMAIGGGSSQVRPKYEITAFDGIRNFLGKDVVIDYAPGYLMEKNAAPNKALIDEATAKAAKADAVIYVGGWAHDYDNSGIWDNRAFDTEASDKTDLTMPFGQDELLKSLLGVNKNTAVVLYGGGPIDMTSWITKAPAVLQAWYPGMEGGTAIANILFGKVNPSGKLPMTFPKKLEDAPTFKFDNDTSEYLNLQYKEGIFVGYRYYDTYKVEPQFPFGHGLSYTNFLYSGLTIKKIKDKLYVSFTVKNSGKVAGSETPQLYVKDMHPSLAKAEKELKAFDKIALKPGESKQVNLVLDSAAFSYYDEATKGFRFDAGEYKIIIGSSSRDIRLQGLVNYN